mgnify:CR=1 FL=1
MLQTGSRPDDRRGKDYGKRKKKQKAVRKSAWKMRSVQTIYLSIKNEKKVLLLFNKPRGIVCSTKQQFDETTVTDYLDYPLRVYPVGRLDKESQGLLLLTNEGDLVNKINARRKLS